jgi:hypothetical protein
MSPERRQVEVAEALCAIACGVSVACLRDRDDRSSKTLLARWLLAAVLKSLGLSWAEMGDSLSAVRGEVQSASVLRDHRRQWQEVTEEGQPDHRRSALARYLAALFEATIRAVRLRACEPIARESVPA